MHSTAAFPAFAAGAPVVGFGRGQAAPAVCARPGAAEVPGRALVTMGKSSKFGLFTPAVVATKVVLGEKRLNRVRGKAIAAHSKAITAFCESVGADRELRQNLIRAAKNNGNTLGFLS